MKWLFIILLSLPIASFSQVYKAYSDFKYYKDTLLVEGVKIKVGDSIRIGTGTRSDNSFSYIFKKPTMMNGASTDPLPAKFNNSFLVLSEIIELNHGGASVALPVFVVSGNKRLKYYVYFSNAIKYKEIIL